MTYKMNIALCEARETHYWLRISKESGLMIDKGINTLIQESEEITKILGAIVSTARGKRKNYFFSFIMLFYFSLIYAGRRSPR